MEELGEIAEHQASLQAELKKVSSTMAELQKRFHEIDDQMEALSKKRDELVKVKQEQLQKEWEAVRTQWVRLAVVYQNTGSLYRYRIGGRSELMVSAEDFPKKDWPDECFDASGNVQHDYLSRIPSERYKVPRIIISVFKIPNDDRPPFM